MRDTSTAYRVKKTFGYAMMVAFLGFSLLPVIWVVLLALRPATALFEPIWESPLAWTLDNIRSIARSDFPKALMNSFITAGSSTLLALLVGVPALSPCRSAAPRTSSSPRGCCFCCAWRRRWAS